MAKAVTDREGSAEAVAAAAETHVARVNEAFTKRFGDFATKKEKAEKGLPDMGFALVLVARALRASIGALVEASTAHDRELADDDAPREARDAAAAELVRLMVGIRAAVEVVFGKRGLKALGIDGRTPTDAKAILEHTRSFLRHLEDPAMEMPPLIQQGVHVEPQVWAGKLRAPLGKLEAARKVVAREEREAQATGDAKAKAILAFDDMFAAGAGFISASLGLVGEWELAAKTRPSLRRAGAIETSVDEEEVGELGGAPEEREAGGAPAIDE